LWFGNDGEDAFVDPRIDVRHVGARIARDSRGVDVLEFAATFAEPSPTPVGLALQVYVDTDGDGDLDWLVVGTDAAVLFNGEYSGEWVTVAVPFPDGAVVPDWDRAVAEFEGDVRLDGAYAVVRVRAETLGIRPGSGTPIDFFVATEDRLWSGRYLDVVDVAPGGAGLTSPDRLWRWHPGDGDLAVWPWTARIEPQGAQTVRVAAARGAADGAGPPPPGILLLYPANVQEPDVAPYFTGQAFPVIVPPHLPGVLSVIHLPAMNTTP
jgi:hypothetical protein